MGQNFNTNAVAEPKPTANGTMEPSLQWRTFLQHAITAKKSLKSKNDEYSRILDNGWSICYSLQNVGFSCQKKYGESHQALSTRPHMLLKERIRIVQGLPVQMT